MAELASNGEAQVASQSQAKPNILDALKLSCAHILATKNVKTNHIEEAKQIFQHILTKFPKIKRAQQELATSNKRKKPTAKQNPPSSSTN